MEIPLFRSESAPQPNADEDRDDRRGREERDYREIDRGRDGYNQR